jgi:hypothetical protein
MTVRLRSHCTPRILSCLCRRHHETPRWTSGPATRLIIASCARCR